MANNRRSDAIEPEAGDWTCLIPSGMRLNTEALLDPSPDRDLGPPRIYLYQCRYCGQEFARSDVSARLPRHLVALHLEGRCASDNPTEGDDVNIIMDLKAIAARLALALPRAAADVLADLRQAQHLLESGRDADALRAAELLAGVGATREDIAELRGDIMEQTFGYTGDGAWLARGLPDHVRFRRREIAYLAASTAAAGFPGEALDMYYKERGYPQVASLRAKLATPRCLVGGKLVLGSEHWLSEADRDVLKWSPIRREVADVIGSTDRMRR
jgi:hypothetical protein